MLLGVDVLLFVKRLAMGGDRLAAVLASLALLAAEADWSSISIDVF